MQLTIQAATTECSCKIMSKIRVDLSVAKQRAKIARLEIERRRWLCWPIIRLISMFFHVVIFDINSISTLVWQVNSNTCTGMNILQLDKIIKDHFTVLLLLVVTCDVRQLFLTWCNWPCHTVLTGMWATRWDCVISLYIPWIIHDLRGTGSSSGYAVRGFHENKLSKQDASVYMHSTGRWEKLQRRSCVTLTKFLAWVGGNLALFMLLYLYFVIQYNSVTVLFKYISDEHISRSKCY